MVTYRMMILMLPLLALANPWTLSGGVGFGQHASNNDDSTCHQSHWHVLTSVSSALYEGMDGRLSFDRSQGAYTSDTMADSNLSIDFRAHMIQLHLRLGAGLGLGFNQRKDTTLDANLNQAYVPFYFDIQPTTGALARWRLSLVHDYLIHPPNEAFLNGFNPLLSRSEAGLHYHHKQCEYSAIYQTSTFSNDAGMQGINTQRIEGQIAYHWGPTLQ